MLAICQAIVFTPNTFETPVRNLDRGSLDPCGENARWQQTVLADTATYVCPSTAAVWNAVHVVSRTFAFSALTLLVGGQEGHPACKKTEWWGAGVVICLELGADLHMAQLKPLPLTVSCFSKIQIGFTFLVPAHPGSPGERAIKRVCVCVFLTFFICYLNAFTCVVFTVYRPWQFL